MQKITEFYSVTLRTPLRLGLISLVISEIVTEGIIFLFGDPEDALMGAAIAGICGFFIAYGASHIFLKYQTEIEDKNIQLEVYQKELQLAKETLEARVDERTKDLLEANLQIQASLREKDILLKEIHHRVKNNLQIVSSLLYLQSRRIDDENVVTLFEESQQRILAMALIHEKLYSSDDLAHIDFSKYVKRLVREMGDLFQAKYGEIKCLVDIEPDFVLDIDYAIPCGLIVNELVSNAYKHAFKNSSGGSIHICMDKNNLGKTELTVMDDGVGFPAGFDLSDSSNMGLQIVSVLVRQLKGEIDVVSENGAKIHITFEERSPQ